MRSQNLRGRISQAIEKGMKRRDLSMGGCIDFEGWAHIGMEGAHFTEAG